MQFYQLEFDFEVDLMFGCTFSKTKFGRIFALLIMCIRFYKSSSNIFDRYDTRPALYQEGQNIC